MAREALGVAPVDPLDVITKGYLGTAATANTGTGVGQVAAPINAAAAVGEVVTNGAFGPAWALPQVYGASRLGLSEWFTGVGPSSTSAIPQGRMVFIPVDIHAPFTIDRLAVEVVTTAGSTGSVARLGIYGTGGSGEIPGTLLLDAGTVATTTPLGLKTITVSFALNRGRYYFVAVNQGAPTTTPITRNNLGSPVPTSISGTPVTLESLLPYQASVTGALPSVTTLVAGGTTVGTRVGFKRA